MSTSCELIVRTEVQHKLNQMLSSIFTTKPTWHDSSMMLM